MTDFSVSPFRTLSGKDIRLGANNMFYVGNITEVEVDSSDEALEQFYRGNRICAMFINHCSGR